MNIEENSARAARDQNDDVHQTQEINPITSLDEELNSISNELHQINFSNRIIINSVMNIEQNSNSISNINLVNDDEIFYEPSLNTSFGIRFGSDDCPRFNCACHKLNLAVRY